MKKLSPKEAVELWEAIRASVDKLETAPRKNWRKIVAGLRRKIFNLAD